MRLTKVNVKKLKKKRTAEKTVRLPASYIGSHSIVKVGTKSVWGRCMIRLTEALIQVLHITNRHFI